MLGNLLTTKGALATVVDVMGRDGGSIEKLRPIVFRVGLEGNDSRVEIKYSGDIDYDSMCYGIFVFIDVNEGRGS